LVLGIDLLLGEFILFGKLLGLLDHSFDFLRSKSSLVIVNLNLLSLSRPLLNSRDRENTIGIDFESDFDLRLSSWGRWNSVEVELTQSVVILGHWSLSFEDLDGDSLLVISIGGEDLGFLGWDFMVSRYDFGHDSSDGLDSEGQRNDVQQNDVLA
jgi:hypothetical protein